MYMALEETRNHKLQLARGTLYDAFIGIWTGEYEGEVIDMNKSNLVNKALLGRTLDADEKAKLEEERYLYRRLRTIVQEIKALKTEEEINAYDITY
jgi:hypothetical protein